MVDDGLEALAAVRQRRPSMSMGDVRQRRPSMRERRPSMAQGDGRMRRPSLMGAQPSSLVLGRVQATLGQILPWDETLQLPAAVPSLQIAIDQIGEKSLTAAAELFASYDQVYRYIQITRTTWGTLGYTHTLSLPCPRTPRTRTRASRRASCAR